MGLANASQADRILAAVGLAATQSAFAADMPAKAPIVKAPMAVATPWTGFYVNGGIGYGMWAADTTDFNPAAGACVICETQVQGGKGWLATIGAGYDYQFTPKIVAGIFGEASISSLKGTVADRLPQARVKLSKHRPGLPVAAWVGWSARRL